MGSYEKIVETLRRCAKEIDCDGCPYYHEDGYWCDQKSIATDAAAAIEELQAGVKRLNMRCADCEYASKPWPELEPKRGKWELIDGAEPMRWGCSRCKYMSWDTSNYCPRCGAKMMEVQE